MKLETGFESVSFLFWRMLYRISPLQQVRYCRKNNMVIQTARLLVIKQEGRSIWSDLLRFRVVETHHGASRYFVILCNVETCHGASLQFVYSTGMSLFTFFEPMRA